MQLIMSTCRGKSRYYIDGKRVTRALYVRVQDSARIRDSFLTVIATRKGREIIRHFQSVRN